MLKIQRLKGEKIRFMLSGRIEQDGVAELKRVLEMELSDRSLTRGDHDVAFDLSDVLLLDREAVHFLARGEETHIELENCPSWIREWIQADRRRNARQACRKEREDRREYELSVSCPAAPESALPA